MQAVVVEHVRVVGPTPLVLQVGKVEQVVVGRVPSVLKHPPQEMQAVDPLTQVAAVVAWLQPDHHLTL
tara:strand:- start:68 stop:271 length:204 start_codon:yes stop_codon:yes gene_type:complete